MYTVVRQVHNSTRAPIILEGDPKYSFDTIEEAIQINRQTCKALIEDHGFKVARLIGVRDRKTGRFVA